jgi:aerobic carbon-monoxide dehydrogenase small subunit
MTELLRFTLNGTPREVAVRPWDFLVDVLREQLGLTGTHIGCTTAQCGACTVLLDGVGVKACMLLALQCAGRHVTTIEGLATLSEGAQSEGAQGEHVQNANLHPMQRAFQEQHGLQCGFCTPGMIMAGLDIVRRHGTQVDARTIAHDLEGNLCRCTGYQNIIKAIEAGAQAMAHARMGNPAA